MTKNRVPVFIPCGYKHEKSFLTKEVDGVREDAINCVMRIGGRNLLCAHPNLDFKGVSLSQDFIVRTRALGDHGEIWKEKFLDIQLAIEVLDNTVYVSYKSDKVRSLLPDNLYIQNALEYIPDIYEIVSILTRCHLYAGSNKDEKFYEDARQLNPGERNRLTHLIHVSQRHIEEKLKLLIQELDKLENSLPV